MNLQFNNNFLYYLMHNNLRKNNYFSYSNKLTLTINNIFFRNFKNINFLYISYNNNKCLNLIKINFLKNKLLLNIIFFFLKKNYLKANELELKGLNYRFTKLNNNLLLDLGRSHFQLVSYPANTFFFSLRKKKFKKILFINFNNNTFNSTLSFFWFKLKKIGPYKLKGFQFLNERIKLKEGKKPFK
jgi:hypothetical protein